MKLHVEIIGHGEPLALIHGWGMHGGVWAPIRTALSQCYQLHLIDLPGMGFSPPMPTETSLTLAALVEGLQQVLPEVSHVLGWSFGGLAAMALATKHPHRLRSLILVASTPKFVNEDDWQHGMKAQLFEQFAGQMAQDYQTTLHKFLSLQCLGSSQARDTLRALKSSFASRPGPSTHSLHEALSILLQADLRSSISRLQLPVLLLQGTRDTLVPASVAEWMHQHLPNSKLTFFNGAGHAPFLSDCDAFVAALNDFLQPEPQEASR